MVPETPRSVSTGEENARFFRLIHASLCRLHVTDSAAAPYSLLHFFGDPLVNELREQCIHGLNTGQSAYWRDSVFVLSTLLRMLLTAPATAQRDEKRLHNLERLADAVCATGTTVASKAHWNEFIHDGPLYTVQCVPWTNCRVVQAIRAAVGALDDQVSFQLSQDGHAEWSMLVDLTQVIALNKDPRFAVSSSGLSPPDSLVRLNAAIRTREAALEAAHATALAQRKEETEVKRDQMKKQWQGPGN